MKAFLKSLNFLNKNLLKNILYCHNAIYIKKNLNPLQKQKKNFPIRLILRDNEGFLGLQYFCSKTFLKIFFIATTPSTFKTINIILICKSIEELKNQQQLKIAEREKFSPIYYSEKFFLRKIFLNQVNAIYMCTKFICTSGMEENK